MPVDPSAAQSAERSVDERALGIVGVVVIGRNEGDRLVACLRSLAGLDVTIVYVDSGSTDGSVDAARRAGAIVVNLDMSTKFTAARARNAGAAAFSVMPEFLQFVDGDCVLAPGWIEVARSFLTSRSDVAVACGRRREIHPDKSLYNRLCDDEWATPIGEATTCGGDAMMRAAAFQSVGGYRDDLIAGEEPELCLRLREQDWKIWRLDAEMTRHDAAMTRFGQWWRRTMRGGHAFAEVAHLHRSSPLRIWARESRRALMWSLFAPASAFSALLLGPATLLALLVYPAQAARLALRRRPPDWPRGALMTIAKFAETQGILQYWIGRLRGRSSSLIEYKH